MNLLQTEEQKLVDRCVKGDLQAKRELYTHFAGKLFSVCLQYAANREEAEDVLQDAFIKIFQNLKQYSGKGSLEGWLRRIVVNTSINQYHKRSKLFLVTNSDHFNDNVADDVSDDEALYDFSPDELMAMIQTLAPRYKMVFNLYAIENYSHKEIAQMLSISEGTSKSQLARARVILQNLIKEKATINVRQQGK